MKKHLDSKQMYLPGSTGASKLEKMRRGLIAEEGGGGRQIRSQLVCPELGEVPPSTSYLLSVTLSTRT